MIRVNTEMTEHYYARFERVEENETWTDTILIPDELALELEKAELAYRMARHKVWDYVLDHRDEVRRGTWEDNPFTDVPFAPAE